jgi:predicted nucleic acid-binding protein
VAADDPVGSLPRHQLFPEEVAEAQTRPLAKSAHCRTLDRLHLATMQVLGFQRLLTNDDRQAAAARALGFDVRLPR